MLLRLLFLCQFSSAIITKYNISYQFLATRTVVLSKIEEARIISEEFYTYCSTNDCIAAIFSDSSEKYYDLLINEQNNCTDLPNCLSFNESDYMYSLIFLHNSNCTDATDLIENMDFVAECPSKFETFTRANGLNWCYAIAKNYTDRDSAETFCQKHYKNSSVNTVESRAEFDALSDHFSTIVNISDSRQSKSAHISLRNYCNSVECNESKNSSTKYIIEATKYFEELLEMDIDGNGNCIKFNVGLYAYNCSTKLSYVSCGKYAD